MKRLVFELTTKCDLNCIFCPFNRIREKEIEFNSLSHILRKAKNLTDTIQFYGHGNNLLYSKIIDVLKLISRYKFKFMISTNGLDFIRIIKKLEKHVNKNTLKRGNFGIYLDSYDPKKNDKIMGINGAFKKTIKSIEYLKENNYKFDGIMRILSLNFRDIEKTYNLLNNLGAISLTPRIIFPFNSKIKNLTLTKIQWKIVEITINRMINEGCSIEKCVWFSLTNKNCNYLNSQYVSIDTDFYLNLCTHTTPLRNLEILNCKNHFEKIFEINKKIRKQLSGNVINYNGKIFVPPCFSCMHNAQHYIKNNIQKNLDGSNHF